MTDQTTKQLLAFADRIVALKHTVRFRGQFFYQDYPTEERYDSVAEHSWRLATFVLLFSRRVRQPFNLERALSMALIHDLPEIITGDASPLGSDGTGRDSHAYDAAKKAAKDAAERQAAHQLFGLLPALERDDLLALYEEYEAQESLESRVVKALDKIEATLQMHEYRRGHIFAAHLAFAKTYGMRGSDVDPAVQAFADALIEQVESMYREFEPTAVPAEA